MIRFARLIAVIALLACLQVGAEEALQPVKMNHHQAHGGLFGEVEPVAGETGGAATLDVEMYLSEERDFDMGLWRTEAFRKDYDEPWPYNEFFHVTEGSLTLISSDGQVTELAKGDSVVIPMGWTGTWDTPGMTKIYVIHAPNKDL